MPCFHPIEAFQLTSGGPLLFWNKPGDYRRLTIPCGRCIGCRLERSRQWAVRCMHEKSMHRNNEFVTLTYSPEHFPSHGSLNYSDYQKFMKRLRKRLGPARFYMCGEYGENFGRPHFHSILFGVSFPDRKPFKLSPSGSMIYRSAILEDLWPFGFSSTAEVTFESAAYVARYVMKKMTGGLAKSHYEALDESTGEIIDRVPEFNRMSLKPGIGGLWFDKYSSDVYPHDRVIVNGKPCKPPRYYDKLQEKFGDFDFEDIKFKRYVDNLKRAGDNTDERLIAREIVTAAKLSQLKRKL